MNVLSVLALILLGFFITIQLENDLIKDDVTIAAMTLFVMIIILLVSAKIVSIKCRLAEGIAYILANIVQILLYILGFIILFSFIKNLLQ